MVHFFISLFPWAPRPSKSDAIAYVESKKGWSDVKFERKDKESTIVSGLIRSERYEWAVWIQEDGSLYGEW